MCPIIKRKNFGYSEINNFYTATVYEKGAELIRMLSLILGENDYYKSLNDCSQKNWYIQTSNSQDVYNKNLVGYFLFASIPPTFAAAIITISGLLILNQFFTE